MWEQTGKQATRLLKIAESGKVSQVLNPTDEEVLKHRKDVEKCRGSSHEKEHQGKERRISDSVAEDALKHSKEVHDEGIESFQETMKTVLYQQQ